VTDFLAEQVESAAAVLSFPGLATLVLAAAFMSILWLVSLAVRDASIVDPFWGLTFVLIAWGTYVLGYVMQGPACLPEGCESPWPPPAALVVPILVTIWGLRLSIYLAWRNFGKGEDYRYVRMRERFGARFPIASLVVVFLLQAGLAWVVSLPVQATRAIDLQPAAPLFVAGVALWALGLAFETLGDLQLAAFRRDPANRGRVLDSGLWRYTRHPNYFGDCCVWWGLYLVAASTGAWWTIVGPILMTVLLVRVSGAALLERTIADRRPGYAEYVRRTSGFFPRPPRP
jgi:steroid 5-alpha reductase family enzyme